MIKRDIEIDREVGEEEEGKERMLQFDTIIFQHIHIVTV